MIFLILSGVSHEIADLEHLKSLLQENFISSFVVQQNEQIQFTFQNGDIIYHGEKFVTLRGLKSQIETSILNKLSSELAIPFQQSYNLIPGRKLVRVFDIYNF